MIKIFLGFAAGAFYGAIAVVETPTGILGKAAAILKMVFFQ